MGSRAKMKGRESLSAQSQPQPCSAFSPQSSHWTIILRSDHCEERLETAFARRLFGFTLYYFLNITNYKVVTGPVTSGSKILLVQKHFAPVQD